jgi:molybdopterin synthase catalytic subunit
MQDSIFTDISEQPLRWPLPPDQFQAADSHGAELVFMGRVRNINHGQKVIALSYDVFVPLALVTLKTICEEAKARWGQKLNMSVIHRMGRLDIGDIAVIVAVSGGHREEVYEASRYLIENLKVRAPIWKKEHYENKDSEWLQGHALCGHRRSENDSENDSENAAARHHAHAAI